MRNWISRRGVSALALLLAVLILPLSGVTPALAATERGSPEEAIALVKRAVELVKTAGTEAAYAAFNDPQGGFTDRDLYVFVIDFTGTTVAHGANKGLIGKTLLSVKDPEGKEFIKDMIALAKEKGEGWVDYKWVNPSTKKIEAKSSYLNRVADTLVGVGIYK